jgi:hypothetical protein
MLRRHDSVALASFDWPLAQDKSPPAYAINGSEGANR